MPAYNRDVSSDEREERFGEALFGDRWVGPLNEAELTLIGYICNATSDWEPAIDDGSGRPPPMYVYRGPAGLHDLTNVAWGRLRRRKDQLACVRDILDLLVRYGPGPDPQASGGPRFDPLERLHSGDDRAEFDKARELYWRIYYEQVDSRSAPPTKAKSTKSPITPQVVPLVQAERAEWDACLARFGRPTLGSAVLFIRCGFSSLAGTAGWIRTTDLLIHSQAL